MSRKNQTTLVWDSVKSPPAGCQGVVLWKSFDCDSYPDAISMPKLIDKNAVEIKKQYLKLIPYTWKLLELRLTDTKVFGEINTILNQFISSKTRKKIKFYAN